MFESLFTTPQADELARELSVADEVARRADGSGLTAESRRMLVDAHTKYYSSGSRWFT